MLFSEEDYLSYLGWLHGYALSSDCSIHSYVLTTIHVPLILPPGSLASAGDLMKRLGQRYVQYINRTYKRSGTLWEGRFRSSIIQQEEYLFTCQRYIEMNSVRTEMVKHPAEYRWLSYRTNGRGEESDIIAYHMLYQNLGSTDKERQIAYRELFRHELGFGERDQIRKATNGNFALGTDRFHGEVSKMIGRRVFPGKAGRPKKTAEIRTGEKRCGLFECISSQSLRKPPNG